MTKSKLLTAGLIAASMLATPVVARENHPSARHLAEGASVSAAGAYASAPDGAAYGAGRFCIPAPRVGAFATQPWDNETPCEPSPASY
jgi:hypothetical protein